MDKTKIKLAAFFDQDDEEPAAQPVDGHKLNHFAQGSVRKSKKDREKEDEERKAREEEAKTAQVLAEFMDEFESDSPRKSKAGGGFVRAGAGPTYAAPSSSRSGLAPPRGPAAMIRQEPELVPRPKGKRAMDAFLDEIKRDQADREARFSRHGSSHGSSATAMAAYEGQSGSRDRGDSETSNLFVANLPTHVTEQAVGMFFAKYGPVGSVKVMWPRTDPAATGGAAAGRSKNSGFSGFVAYMRRKDAENALRELDGFSWSGSILRVGWSKSVPVPARPMYVNPAAQSLGDKDQPSTTALSRKRSRSRDRDYDRHERRSHRSRSRSPRHSGRDRRPSRSRSYERSHRSRQDRSRSPRRRSRSRSRDARDQDDLGEEISDGFIRTVASQVKGNDEVYEKSLMDYESKNPRYAFFQDRHPKHRYYRSCLDKRREIQPEFDDDGYNSSYSTDSEEEEERENGHKTELGRLARRRFQAMLRGISGRRGELARCMAFSLEHAEAAAEVADVLIASLLVEGTPVPRKVSRLHLVCDILHNSAIPLPGAWRFRQEFQSRLGLVFDHLAGIYHSFPGRITADTFKTQITAIIDIWEDWIVFPPEFTAQLRMRLEGQSSTTDEEVADAPVVTSAEPDVVPELPRFKASSFKPAAPPTLAEASAAGHEDIDGAPIGGIDDDLDGASVEDVDGASIEDVDGAPFEDLDGVPLEDLDGSPLRDPDGVPLDDMDGAPLDDVDGTPPEGDDVDGAPLNDDVDGVPMDLEA